MTSRRHGLPWSSRGAKESPERRTPAHRADGEHSTCRIEHSMSRNLRWLVAFVCFCLVLLPSCGGNAGSSQALNWQYTALGDSLAVGVLDSQGGYVRRFRTDIATDTGATVTLTDLGVNGAHSSDLLNSLQNDPNFRNAVSASQVVTFDIGGDDLLHAIGLFQQGQCGGADNQDCLRSAVATFMPNWDAIVQQLLTLRNKNNTIIRTMDIYNPFVAQLQAQGTFNNLEPYLDRINQHIAASAQANGIPMAQVHAAFNGPSGTDDAIAKGLITVDGVHPNEAGHQVIAEAFRALGYSPLH
jgi:lysophospholipase L1-like esterase